MSSRVRLVLSVAFFFSGCSALMLQLAWQRLLLPWMGGDVGAVSLAVAVFMTGLALGGALGGWWGRRRDPRDCLRSLMVAELCVALFSLAGLSGMRSLNAWSAVMGCPPQLGAGLLILACMLPSAMAMGVSFPMLVAALAGRDGQVASVVAPRLSAVNTLGAGAGALTIGWVIFPLWGIHNAVAVAATLNAVVAAVVWTAARSGLEDPPTETEASGPAPHAAGSAGLRQGLVFSAMLGFGSLAVEMVFLRVLGAMCKASAQTAGSLLFLYLAAMGIGALWGAKRQAVRDWPAMGRLLGLALVLGALLPAFAPVMARWLGHGEYLAGYEPLDASSAWTALLQKSAPGAAPKLIWTFLGLQWLVPLLVIFPSGFLFGLAQVRLQGLLLIEEGSSCWILGWNQFWGVVGALVGTLGVWLVGFPWLGSASLLGLLLLLGMLWLAWFSGTRLRLAFVIAASAGLLVMPDQHELWSMVHGATVRIPRIVEDSTGVSVITEQPGSGFAFHINGIGQSWIPYGGIHTQLGALPLLLHPRPERVALIGLGSGDTLNAMLCRPETRSVVCTEIVGAQIQTLRALGRESGMEWLGAMLKDPRLELRVQDGRQMLQQEALGFDVIEMDAMRPNSAHAGVLYSSEFFQLIRSRLRPGGMAVTWLPSLRVARTLLKVFPHVAIVAGSIGLASNEPLPLASSHWQQRLASRSLQDHFWRSKVDIVAEVTAILGPHCRHEVIGADFNRESLTDLNTDAFPRDEFMLPGLWGQVPP